MKRTRKGFTLVELLIVVAILATLTATMMVSMRGATAKAKAASIAANLESCHTAAMLYYAASGDKNIADVEAKDMLTVNLKTWNKLKGGTVDAIVYNAVGKGPDNWTVTVDFSKDSEKKDIASALHNMRGYSNVTLIAFDGINALDIILGAGAAYAEGDSTDGLLFMHLITGKVFAGTTTDGTYTDTGYDDDSSASSSSESGTGGNDSGSGQ